MLVGTYVGLEIRSNILYILVQNYLNKVQADVCLLQETHLTDPKSTALKSPQFPYIYLTNCNSRQRGVAILTNNRNRCTHNKTIEDPEGRFIIVTNKYK